MADVVAPSTENPGALRASAFEPVAPNNNVPEKPAWNGAGTGVGDERLDSPLQNGGALAVSNGHSYTVATAEADRIVSASAGVDINGLVIDAHGEADAAPCEAFNPDSLPKEPRGRLPSPLTIDRVTAPPQQHQEPLSPSPPPASPRRSPGPRKATPTRIPSLRQRPKSVGCYEDAARRSGRDPASTSSSSASPRPSSCVVRSNSTSRKDKIADSKLNMSGVKSRTMSHTTHKPGGGNIKIFDQKVDYSHVKARSDIGSAKTSPRKSGSSEPTSPRVKTAPPQLLPNTKNVHSKIGSKDNMKHTPGGGKVKIHTEKVNFSTIPSKCGSLDNSKHQPGGGNVKTGPKEPSQYVICITMVKQDSGADAPPPKPLPPPTPPRVDVDGRRGHSAGQGARKMKRPPQGKIFDQKLDISMYVRSRVGSLDNTYHTPGGGNLQIYEERLNFKRKALSRIGSFSNARHKPSDSSFKILDEKVDFTSKVQSKVGSLEKASHTPAGGQVKLVSEKLEFDRKAKSRIGSLDNISHSPGGGVAKIETKKLDFSKTSSKVGSKDNIKHQPQGGNKKIINEKLDFKAESKIGSKDNIKHQAGGGKVKITNEKVDFVAKASSKIGSKDNIGHKPGGGNVQIVDEKLDFKGAAAPRTDTGTAKEPMSPGAGSQTRSSRGSRSSVGSQEEVEGDC